MASEYLEGDSASTPAAAIVAAWERERPGLPLTSIPVVTPIIQLAKLFLDDRRRVLADAGADPATLDLLSVLRRSGPPYVLGTRELAARSLVSAGAVSQRLARAEADGLVERRPGAGRRAVDVALTPAGHALIEDLVDRVLTRETELVDSLDDATRVRLAGLLDALLADVRPRVRP